MALKDVEQLKAQFKKHYDHFVQADDAIPDINVLTNIFRARQNNQDYDKQDLIKSKKSYYEITNAFYQMRKLLSQLICYCSKDELLELVNGDENLVTMKGLNVNYMFNKLMYLTTDDMLKQTTKSRQKLEKFMQKNPAMMQGLLAFTKKYY